MHNSPSGIFPYWTYGEDAVQFGPGDLVLDFTNDVTEAENPAGEESRGSTKGNGPRPVFATGLLTKFATVRRSLSLFEAASIRMIWAFCAIGCPILN